MKGKHKVKKYGRRTFIMHTFEITYMERKSMTFRRKNVKMVVAKSIYLLPMIAKIALQGYIMCRQ